MVFSGSNNMPPGVEDGGIIPSFLLYDVQIPEKYHPCFKKGKVMVIFAENINNRK